MQMQRDLKHEHIGTDELINSIIFLQMIIKMFFFFKLYNIRYIGKIFLFLQNK